MKNYLEIEESQGVFANIQEEIKVREIDIRAKLAELELTIMEVRDTARGSQARSKSPLTNTHMVKEIGGIKG